MYTIALVATLLFAGFYFYQAVSAVCPVPLTYRIGHIDDRFDLDVDEAKEAVENAAEVWESATGRDLFVFDPLGDLTINFVYDERQAELDAANASRDRLESAENVSDAIDQTYETLVSRLDALDAEYRAARAEYESHLLAHNNVVDSYNDGGGVPPEVFALLKEEEEQLRVEADVVDDLGRRRTELTIEVNRLGREGNELISDYNEEVVAFNERYAKPDMSDSFENAGVYQKGQITIYSFTSMGNLVLVLAHELGHAISLEHVSDSESVMHYLLDQQSPYLELTDDDLSEFDRVCGDSALSSLERLKIVFGFDRYEG